jgi:hypothetical protein
LGHEEQAWANVKAMAILEELVQAPARSGILLEDGDVIALPGQTPSEGDAANSSTDHEH